MTRTVTLITGPPCAGKTTWANHHAQPHDTIIDWDTIAQQLGSPHQWHHTPLIKHRTNTAIANALHHIAQTPNITAWVIRTAPEPAERTHLATYLQATRVVVLLPPIHVLHHRADQRPHPTHTRRAITTWLTRYTPHPHDELIHHAQI